MKTALVCGAGGFIGSHLVKKLKEEDYWVRGIDLKLPEFEKTKADHFIVADLRKLTNCLGALVHPQSIDLQIDEVYQLAADMGGAGYIFTGDHDADVMHNSAQINLHFASLHDRYKRIFYSSSACMYPAYNQVDPNNPNCAEDSAYPAAPDSEYGWEKLFSERLYLAHHRNYGVEVRLARFHNIFGPYGSWNNGKEKAPAAMCRKIAETTNGGEIEIWGDGTQTRSFLYIDACIEGIRRLMNSDWTGPVNIGSDEMITINQLAEYVTEISDKKDIHFKHITGPLGVKGRNSDNNLIQEKLGWKPEYSVKAGLKPTYKWINQQVQDLKK